MVCCQLPYACAKTQQHSPTIAFGYCCWPFCRSLFAALTMLGSILIITPSPAESFIFQYCSKEVFRSFLVSILLSRNLQKSPPGLLTETFICLKSECIVLFIGTDRTRSQTILYRYSHSYQDSTIKSPKIKFHFCQKTWQITRNSCKDD